MTTDYRNQIEIRNEGMDALVQRLGRTGSIRFLQLFSKGNGDYTQERDAIFQDMGIDDIADEIIRRRK